jgi:DNA topoisomerase-1
MITAGLGRFGPYVKHGPTYKSLAADDDVLTVGLNRAVSLIADAKPGRGRAPPLKVLGEHPDDKQPVELYSGRYGHYVKHGKTNATVPNGIEPMEIALEQAIPLLAARAAKGKPVRAKKAAKPKAAKPKKANGTAENGEAKAAKPAKQANKTAPKKKAAKAAGKPAKKKSEPQADAA